MEKIIDLHIHTSCSDGKLTPREVIDMAVNNNVSIISITDHDTILAYNDELFDYAKKLGIRIIPGVEISTKNNKCGIHVLGYNIDIYDEEFKNNLDKLCNARKIYLNEVVEVLRRLGYVVSLDRLEEIEVVTKAHIAEEVVSNKENYELLIRNFGHIPNKGEFIETIMNEGCPAYVKKYTISPREAVELIEKAHGVAVLAHPVAYKYEDRLTEDDITKLVNEMNVEAIEANYIYIDRNNNKINECSIWREFALKNKLITTIGSDYHEDDGLRPVIGLLGEDIEMSEKDLDKMIEYLNKKDN